MSEINKVLIWLFQLKHQKDLAELPGLDSTKAEYLLKDIDPDSYWDFANCPPCKLESTKSAKANMVNIRLLALHNFWWKHLTQDKTGNRNVVLPHPKELGVSPIKFTDLYMADTYRKQFYTEITLQSPKQTVQKYTGKPSTFKFFMESLKAAAANTSLELARCIGSKAYAKSQPEVNTNLYNWAISCVDQQTAELHFYPNEGNGYAALESMAKAPSVQSNEKAELNLSKKHMETLKCNGHDLTTYVDRFLYLASKAKLTDDKEKVRMFAKGFAETSPYQDKLKRLLEEEKSLDEITAALHSYYATVVCLSVPALKETTQQDEEGTVIHDTLWMGMT